MSEKLIAAVNAAGAERDWPELQRLAAELRKAVPNSVIGYIKGSLARRRLGDRTGAKELQDLAIARFPENWMVNLSTAQLSSDFGQWSEAAKICDDLLQRYPDNQHIITYAAGTYLNAGYADRAKALAVRSLNNRDDRNLRRILVKIFLRQSRWLDAARECARLRARYPAWSAGYHDAVLPLINLGAYSELLSLLIDRLTSEQEIGWQDYRIAADAFIQCFDKVDAEDNNLNKLIYILAQQPPKHEKEPGFNELIWKLTQLTIRGSHRSNILLDFFRNKLSALHPERKQALRFIWYAFSIGDMKPSNDDLKMMVTTFSLKSFCMYFSHFEKINSPRKALTDYLKYGSAETLATLTEGQGENNLPIFLKVISDEIDIRSLPVPPSVYPPAPPMRKKTRSLASKRLKIALCISGQLRGYMHAFESWRNLGLDQHETHAYVHSWKNIGRSPPLPGKADRSFSGNFLNVYLDSLTANSTNFLKRQYPSLFKLFYSDSNVAESNLTQFYSADSVCLEDDADEPFAKFSNAMKMYYKIEAAWKLAEDSGIDFDLVFRLRPDREIIAKKRIDWNSICKNCYKDSIIYSESPFRINPALGFVVGDQFAVTIPELMREYATTFTKSQDSSHPMRTHISKLLPHASLAFSMFYAGIESRYLDSIEFGDFFDPEPIPPKVILSSIQADVAAREVTELDKRWIAALEGDIAKGHVTT